MIDFFRYYYFSFQLLNYSRAYLNFRSNFSKVKFGLLANSNEKKTSTSTIIYGSNLNENLMTIAAGVSSRKNKKLQNLNNNPP